jgi:hypothetical protein
VSADQAVNSEKYKNIRQLMDLTGSSNIANQFAASASQNIFRSLKASRPEIPDRAIEIMNRELLALFQEKMDAPGGLMEKLLPIYDKYFTDDEIKQIIAFYQTPVGKKTIAVLPKIVSESMMAGQQWGQSLQPEINRRIETALKKEGLLPTQKQK